jgi:hypothetical protein
LTVTFRFTFDAVGWSTDPMLRAPDVPEPEVAPFQLAIAAAGSSAASRESAKATRVARNRIVFTSGPRAR